MTRSLAWWCWWLSDSPDDVGGDPLAGMMMLVTHLLTFNNVGYQLTYDDDVYDSLIDLMMLLTNWLTWWCWWSIDWLENIGDLLTYLNMLVTYSLIRWCWRLIDWSYDDWLDDVDDQFTNLIILTRWYSWPIDWHLMMLLTNWLTCWCWWLINWPLVMMVISLLKDLVMLMTHRLMTWW